MLRLTDKILSLGLQDEQLHSIPSCLQENSENECDMMKFENALGKQDPTLIILHYNYIFHYENVRRNLKLPQFPMILIHPKAYSLMEEPKQRMQEQHNIIGILSSADFYPEQNRQNNTSVLHDVLIEIELYIQKNLHTKITPEIFIDLKSKIPLAAPKQFRLHP